MSTIKSDTEATQLSATNSLLFTIISVIFIVFFVAHHDIFYSINSAEFSFSQEEVSSFSRGSIERQRMFFLLFLFSTIMFIKGKSYSFIFRDSLGWLILANLSWAMLSYFWADDPALTGKRIVLLVIFYFAALSISMNVPLRQLPTIVLGITAPILIIGIVSERALGTWWFRDPDYRFSGTFHPEGQAINCAMLFLAAATMTRKGGRLSRLMILGLMVLAAVFLVLTKSRGPFVGAIIAFGLYELCTKKRSSFVVYMYAAFVILGIMAAVIGNQLFPLLGSGMNLGRQEGRRQESIVGMSGRTELWEQMGEYVKERPIHGYGFGGFWTEDRVLAVSDSHGWRISDSHSLYIDTVLDCGLIGLAVFLTLVIVAWRREWRTCVNREDKEGAFALSLLTLWMADGLWSSLTLGRGFPLLLLLTLLFCVTRESQLQRARRAVTTER